MADNPECNKDGHKMHMCALKENEFDKKNPDKFREMTENPEYKCGTCQAKTKKSKIFVNRSNCKNMLTKQHFS
jgi:hypothetical protein